MPIMYVNPAKGRRRKKAVSKKRKVATRKRKVKAKRDSKGRFLKKSSARRKKTTTRRKTTMAIKRRRRKPATKRRKNSSAKRKAAARKAAATRRAKAAKRSAAARKAARTRKRRKNAWHEPKNKTVKRRVAGGHSKAASKGWAKKKKRKTTKRKKRASAPKRRRKSASKAKRTYTPPGMRSNPSRRRRRRRKNPGLHRGWAVRRRKSGRRKNSLGGIMDLLMKKALPTVGTLYAARLVSGKLSSKIPGLDKIPDQFRGPALAAALVGAGHFATKKVAMLKKHRESIMVGLAINFIDQVVGAFAPADIKGMIGISDADTYGPQLAEYMTVDDYVTVGADPIDDDITLADYVQIGELEQDLGMLEQDLGVEEDLGDFANRHLGGVSRSSMAAPVAHKKYLAPVPARSFTKPVPGFSDNFDNPSRLNTGIFSGGW